MRDWNSYISHLTRKFVYMNPILKNLQIISALIAQRSEVVVIFVVIGIIFMMILPLPTVLVDSLIALNICISTLMVVMAMYMPGPLAFSTFPALLLITTLFRMGLSITTTRLILLQGDAGNIVEAFGSFVVGGNLVVGLVIFLILTLVNFLVITKGSERVAEVSARFTLDAMPGKQMSIDSDLRAGLLDAATAQKKRGDVGRESQLFGAMDGAMKFVKGDAIAGIIIVMVNILGGFSIGVTQLGLPAGEAIKVYSILTIGDGLVAQIPALLISLTAGMIITRVSDSTGAVTNIGQDMASELTSEPKSWIIAAFVMLGFALIPGMPSVAFICFALFFGACGAFQITIKTKNAQLIQQQQLAQQKAQLDNLTAQAQNPEADQGNNDLKTFIPYEKMCFVYNSKSEGTTENVETLKAIRRARNKIVMDKGYTLPSIEKAIDNTLSETSYKLLIYGVPRLIGSLCHDRLAVMLADTNEDLIKKMEGQCQRGRVSDGEHNIIWVKTSFAEQLKSASIPYQDNASLIYQRTQDFLRKESYQFIGIEETTKIMNWLNSEFPSLSQEVQRNVPLSKIAEILQNLAMENISIRSVRKVVEVIAERASSDTDITSLIDSVRIGLKDQICNELSQNNTLRVFLLEKEVEELLRASMKKTGLGNYITLSQEHNKRLMTSLAIQTKIQRGKNPILVVAQDLRRSVRELIKGDFFNLPILSYQELTESVKIEPVARISFSSPQPRT